MDWRKPIQQLSDRSTSRSSTVLSHHHWVSGSHSDSLATIQHNSPIRRTLRRGILRTDQMGNKTISRKCVAAMLFVALTICWAGSAQASNLAHASWLPSPVAQDGIPPYQGGAGDWIPPQGYNPGYDPGYDPAFDPAYDPGYMPGVDGMDPGYQYPIEGDVYEPAPVDHWFSWEEWDASFEAGLNGSDGNSDTLSLTTGFELTRTTEFTETGIDFQYNTTHNNQIETQNNALMRFGHEWLFPDSPWSAFMDTDLLYDRFKAFDLRLVLNGGLAYTHIKNETTTFKTRYGAGVSREIGGPDNAWKPEALFGFDYTRQMTKRQKLNLTVDYFPEWGSFSDYRLVSDFSWELLIDEEANLSLKLDVTDQYDSTPNGVRPNDIFYSLLLLWKL